MKVPSIEKIRFTANDAEHFLWAVERLPLWTDRRDVSNRMRRSVAFGLVEARTLDTGYALMVTAQGRSFLAGYRAAEKLGEVNLFLHLWKVMRRANSTR